MEEMSPPGNVSRLLQEAETALKTLRKGGDSAEQRRAAEALDSALKRLRELLR